MFLSKNKDLRCLPVTKRKVTVRLAQVNKVREYAVPYSAKSMKRNLSLQYINRALP